MNRSALKYKITSSPIDKDQLVFYFAERYTKRSNKKLKTQQHLPQKEQSPSIHKIALVSKSKPILSFKRSHDVNKTRLTTFQILKSQINYLDDQNVEKFELKSKNLDVFQYMLQSNCNKDIQKLHLDKNARKNVKKSLVQQLVNFSKTSKVRANTTVTSFFPYFPQDSADNLRKKTLPAQNDLALLKKKLCKTSMARRYFGSSKKLSESPSKRLSERPLIGMPKNEKSDKSQPTLTRATFTLN